MPEQDPFARLPSIDGQKRQKLLEFAELLREQNAKVNLISRKDMEDVEYRHVAFCAALGEFFSPASGARIADVGTGGGLPGIVAAILWPPAQIFMFDGVGRKIAAVAEMVKSLGLKNASALHARLEEQKDYFDYALGRSVCALPQFFSFAARKLVRGKKGSLENGVIYFKGGELEPEFSQKNVRPTKIMDLEKLFADERFSGKNLMHFALSDVLKIAR